MNLKYFGSNAIFRPSIETVQTLQQKSHRLLLEKFPPGEYLGMEKANPILQSIFEFHDSRLRRIASEIASRNTAEFLLFQYDESSEILHGESIIAPEVKQEWLRIGPSLRRGIKFIVELFCIARKTDKDRISPRACLPKLEEALYHAECATHLAEISNRTYQIFPNDFQLILYPKNSPHIFATSVIGKHSDWDARFQERIERDRNFRSSFMGPSPQFDIHTHSHRPFLDKPFTNAFGMSYGEFISILFRVINDAKPLTAPPPTLFIRRTDLVKEICRHGYPREAAERVLRGFTVTANMLEEEGRVIWKPKQESRAYRRGFFSFPHETGTHLAFSRAMARESLIHLITGGCYKKLPPEWTTPEITEGLGKLSLEAGNWFEKLIKMNLETVGYKGNRAKRRVGIGSQALEIPNDVGELDFLGYNPTRKEVILVEAKMTNAGLESCYWRNDLSEFVYRRQSYANKFRKKIEWVKANWAKIIDHLGAKSDYSFSTRMVTLYPCIATEFIDDFSCTSITELMLELRR